MAHITIYRSGKYSTMPRLSLYRPEKGNDYKFIDKTIWEMFQVGGTDVLVHKYLGPGDSIQGNTPSTPEYTGGPDPFQIQDLLFLENRDRKYAPDIYILRGAYNVQDTDFNLSQFGLFLQNDTIFITFHINDTVEKIGRKLISGDVIELPHLKDEFALNDLQFALKRFYVIEEVTRAAEGYSVTWYPHLYRAKCKPLVDSQEFKQILDEVINTDAVVGPWNTDATYYPGDIVIGPDGIKYNVIKEVSGMQPPNSTYYEIADSLRDIMSTYEKEMQITQAVLDQAELDSPKSGYDTSKFYTIQRDDFTGRAEIVSVDTTDLDASVQTQATDIEGNLLFDENGDPIYVGSTASTLFQSPEEEAYTGYLTEDGVPANGSPLTAGIAFPLNPVLGQYCLRTDYLPNRLFRYTGSRWQKVENVLRHTMNNLGESDIGVEDRYSKDAQGNLVNREARQTLKTSFVNNNNATGKDKVSFDVLFLPTRDNKIQTATNYAQGMFVEVYIGEVKVKSSVSEGAAGKALINMTKYANPSDRVQYRLYNDSIPEKQSLSRALRPQADN